MCNTPGLRPGRLENLFSIPEANGMYKTSSTYQNPAGHKAVEDYARRFMYHFWARHKILSVRELAGICLLDGFVGQLNR